MPQLSNRCSWCPTHDSSRCSILIPMTRGEPEAGFTKCWISVGLVPVGTSLARCYAACRWSASSDTPTWSATERAERPSTSAGSMLAPFGRAS